MEKVKKTTSVGAEIVEQKSTAIVAQPEQTVNLLNFPSAHQITEYKEFLQNYDKFIGEMLSKDTDYGIIPGVEKPSLFKPGAEKLEKLMFLRHEKELVEKVIEPNYNFVKYSYRTKVYNKSGQIVATCEGSCNSHEKKYRFTTVFENQATSEQKANGRLESRTSKNGKPYKVYVVEKTDFHDMENTIMKMAQKRSYVGAILEATNSSGRFTQDVEDMDIPVPVKKIYQAEALPIIQQEPVKDYFAQYSALIAEAENPAKISALGGEIRMLYRQKAITTKDLQDLSSAAIKRKEELTKSSD